MTADSVFLGLHIGTPGGAIGIDAAGTRGFVKSGNGPRDNGLTPIG
jgi:hypothetical protein